MSCSTPHQDGFRHEALFYRDEEELLAGTLPFLRTGIEADEPILVVMPQASLDLVRGHLQGEAERVQFANMEELGRNPARIIAAWRDFFDEHYDEDHGMRGIGEPIWVGRTAAELDECRRHESLLNLAFADAPAWSLLCPYDSNGLDDEVLVAAEQNHPVLAGRTRSAEFAAESLDVFAGELQPPTGQNEELCFELSNLRRVRELIREHGTQVGLADQAIADLALAANEIATNSVRHGGGGGTVVVWRSDDALVCDFRDSGVFDDPLVGRSRPGSAQLGGRGVWLANQVCDLVQIRSDAAGSLVRLRMGV